MYTANWLTFNSFTGGFVGLAFGSTAYTRITGGVLDPFASTTYQQLHSQGSIFLTGSSGTGTLVRASAPRGASVGTLSTLICIYDRLGTSSTNNGEAGIVFLQTQLNAASTGTSCYGVVWQAGANQLALRRYDAGFVQAGGTTLDSAGPDIFAIGTPLALGVSWAVSTGGLTVRATTAPVDSDGSATAATTLRLSYVTLSGFILPASGIAEGFGVATLQSCFVMAARTTMNAVV